MMVGSTPFESTVEPNCIEESCGRDYWEMYKTPFGKATFLFDFESEKIRGLSLEYESSPD